MVKYAALLALAGQVIADQAIEARGGQGGQWGQGGSWPSNIPNEWNGQLSSLISAAVATQCGCSGAASSPTPPAGGNGGNNGGSGGAPQTVTVTVTTTVTTTEQPDCPTGGNGGGSGGSPPPTTTPPDTTPTTTTGGSPPDTSSQSSGGGGGSPTSTGGSGGGGSGNANFAALQSDLTKILSDTQGLQSSISSFASAADASAVLTAVGTLNTDIKQGTSDATGSLLTDDQANQLITPVTNLANAVDSAIQATISKKSTFDGLGLSSTVQGQLQTIQTNANTFAAALVKLVPSGEQSQAQALATRIQNSLASGVSAYGASSKRRSPIKL